MSEHLTKEAIAEAMKFYADQAKELRPPEGALRLTIDGWERFNGKEWKPLA
jgi:hypothetical protein